MSINSLKQNQDIMVSMGTGLSWVVTVLYLRFIAITDLCLLLKTLQILFKMCIFVLSLVSLWYIKNALLRFDLCSLYSHRVILKRGPGSYLKSKKLGFCGGLLWVSIALQLWHSHQQELLTFVSESLKIKLLKCHMPICCIIISSHISRFDITADSI